MLSVTATRLFAKLPFIFVGSWATGESFGACKINELVRTLMGVLGLDICKGMAVGCYLTERPKRLLDYLNSRDFRPLEFPATREGIEAMLKIPFHTLVLEPTGMHYSRIFAYHSQKAGRRVCWVNHSTIASFREAHQLANKNDDPDALSLAAYWFDNLDDDGNPLIRSYVHPQLWELRQLWLNRQGVIKGRVRWENRLKLELEHNFPEVAEFDLNRRWSEPITGVITWLAGTANQITKTRYDRMFFGGFKTGKKKHEETAPSIGIGINEQTKWLAQQIIDCEDRCFQIEQEIDRMLQDERFKPYFEVFNSLGLSPYLASILLTKIYPFERFLDPQGKEVIIYKRTRAGKYSKRYLSRSWFKASIGQGKRELKSGKRQGRSNQVAGKRRKKRRGDGDDQPTEVSTGCIYCRLALNQWLDSGIKSERNNKRPLKALEFREQYLKMKESGLNGFEINGKLSSAIAVYLFKELYSKLGNK